MNGRIAQSALSLRHFAARNLRALVLGLCCVMSVAMLGAIRAQTGRPHPIAQAPLAEWNDYAPPLGALNESEQRTLVSTPPARVELLRPSTPAAPLPAAAAARFPMATPAMIVPPPRTILMEVTAYCACTKCCGPRARGITASGKRVSYNGGRFVAADTRLLKFNTKLLVPGYAAGRPVEVIDRGGAIKGNKLDVYFDSHQEARRWGRQWLLVTVVD